MPVIYDKEMGRQWLEQSFGHYSMPLGAVLQPLPSDLMEAHEASPGYGGPSSTVSA